MPREINFIVPRGQKWRENYEMARFPSPGIDGSTPGDYVTGTERPLKEIRNLAPRPLANQNGGIQFKPDKATLPAPGKTCPVQDLPELNTIVQDNLKDSSIEKMAPTAKVTAEGLKLMSDVKPFIKLGCALGLTSSAVWVGDDLVFGAGLIVILLNTKTLIQKPLTGHNRTVVGCGYLESPDLIISCQSDGLVRLWKRSSGQGLICLKSGVAATKVETFQSRFCLFGVNTVQQSKSLISMWEWSEGKLLQIASACTDHAINTVVFEPSFKSFVTGGPSGLKVWRLARGNHLRSGSIDFGQYTSKLNVVSLQWASEGSILLAAGQKGTIFRVDIETLSIIEVHQLMLSGQAIEVSAIMLIADKLLVASSDGVCRMWTPQLTQVKGNIDLGGAVTALQRNGTSCLVTTDARSIGRLDFTTNEYSTYYRAPKSTNLITCSISGDLIGTLSDSGQLQVWKYRRQVDYAQNYNYSIVQLLQINSNDISAISLNKDIVAVGHQTGKISAYKNSPTGSQQILDKNGCDSILDVHFSPTGQLYAIDARGEFICFGATLSVSRHLRRGASRHPANHIVSSPGGRFVAVLSFESNAILQLYSSQLDPLVEISPKTGSQMLVDYYFLRVGFSKANYFILRYSQNIKTFELRVQKTHESTQTILIIDREKHATVCNIGESSTLEAAREIHFTTAKINGLYLDSKLHVTSTEDQLRVWPNNFSKAHCQDYLGHLAVNKMAKNDTNLVTVGDTALVWNVGEMNGRDIRLGHESALLKYHDQKMAQSGPNLDETITVEKKSLFSVLNDDSTDLSVQEPQPTSPPSPIPFEPNLDITPPHQCSSPINEIIDQQSVLHTSRQSMDQSIRVIRHHDPRDVIPEAKSVVFTQNRKVYDQTNLFLPMQISQAQPGSEALKLTRAISSHCATQWASNRGKLVYASGTQFCTEELDSGKQERLSLGAHITTLALAPDEVTCSVFGLTTQGNVGFVVDLEKNKINDYSICIATHQEQISLARISKDSKYCLSLSGTFDAQLVINNTWNGLQSAQVKLPLQIANYIWSNGNQFITVGSDITIWTVVVELSGTINELKSRILPMPHVLSSELFTTIGICPQGQQAVVGTKSGLVVTLNLNAPNFEVEHYFTASQHPLTCVSYFTSGRILTASENNVVFWQKRNVTLTGQTGSYDGNGLFVTDDEFELDSACISALVSNDDYDEMAVCTTEQGTVVFCAAETLATLVASTDQCSCISQDKYTVTGHENGALKVWKKVEENFKMLIHFQAAEAVHSCTIENNIAVGGYGKGIIRIFDIVEGQMTLKLSVPQLTDIQVCALKFVPNGLIAGSSDGRVYLYERDGGLQRQFNDHYKSGKITQIDYDGGLDHFQHLTLGGELWLVSSEQGKISVWTSVWERRGTHHLAAWISCKSDNPVRARFSRTEPDQVYYWTSQMFYIYSLKGQSVIKQLSLPYVTDLLVSHPLSDLFLLASGRLLTLAELSDEQFIYQDYPHHTEAIKSAHFGGDHVLTVTSRQLYHWLLK